MEDTKLVPAQTVLQHNKPDDCWVVVDDEIWDITDFVPEHPGGATSESRPSLYPWLFSDRLQLSSSTLAGMPLKHILRFMLLR